MRWSSSIKSTDAIPVDATPSREIEVDFRSGTHRVQVNVELEDGEVRERVRVRDDADHGGDDDSSDDDHGGSDHSSVD